jgi:hypothetical protein
MYETCGCPRQATNLAPWEVNNLAPVPILVKGFWPRTGLVNIFWVHAQTVNNFQRNACMCGKHKFTSTIFLVNAVMSYTP